MPLETGDYLANLNPDNPTGGDPKDKGDDHLRLVKAVLVNSFVGFTGTVLVSGVDGGVENAYTLTPAHALKAYTERTMVIFRPLVPNSGAVTLNISALGPKEVVSVAGVPLVAGDLTAGRYYTAFYDGAKFRLDNVTQNYVDQLVISGIVPGVNDPANAGKALVGGGQWTSLDGRGEPTKDKGNTGTAAQIVNYADGEGQTITATGAHSLTATGFPADRMAGILLRMKGYGNFALTTTGITWIKADGTETVNFATSGIVLSAGTSHVALWSHGDGVIYAKVAR